MITPRKLTSLTFWNKNYNVLKKVKLTYNEKGGGKKVNVLLSLKYTGKGLEKVLYWIRAIMINLFTWPFIECGVEKGATGAIHAHICEYCGAKEAIGWNGVYICGDCLKKVFSKVLKTKKGKK